jgi:hypothetical protein
VKTCPGPLSFSAYASPWPLLRHLSHSFDRPQPIEFSYRSGDILLPQVKVIEPVRFEAEHSLTASKTNHTANQIGARNRRFHP